MSTDFFPTPAWCVWRALDAGIVVPQPGAQWLEPCVGDGAIVRAVAAWCERNGAPTPTWTTCDIRPETGADVIASFHGLGRPLLDQLVPPSGAWDVVLTNPPFSEALEFIAEAFVRARRVAMLLRLAWMTSADRNEWAMEHMPRRLAVLPDRPSFDGEGSDNSAYGWHLWAPWYGPGSTTDAPIRRRLLGPADFPARAELEVLPTTPLEERRVRL